MLLANAYDIPILMYHHVQLEEDFRGSFFSISITRFQQQLDWLKEHGYKTISFGDLFHIISGTSPYTGKEVLITFDDGYESFKAMAVPELLARGMTATVFVVVGLIGQHNDWDSDVIPGYQERPLMNEEAI